MDSNKNQNLSTESQTETDEEEQVQIIESIETRYNPLSLAMFHDGIGKLTQEGIEIFSSSIETGDIPLVHDYIEHFIQLSDINKQRILLETLSERLFWRIAAYMHRYSDRLTSGGQTYSDRVVGLEEFQCYMGMHQGNDSYTKKWLETRNVPPLNESLPNIFIGNAIIHAVREQSADIPIIRIARDFSLTDTELEILATLILAMHSEPVLRLMTVVWADFSVKLPTVSFISYLLSDDDSSYKTLLNAFSESGVLRRMHLIKCIESANFPGGTPLIHLSLNIDQSVIDIFMGNRRISDSLPNAILHKDALPTSSLIGLKKIRQQSEYAYKELHGHHRIVYEAEPHTGRRTLSCALAKKHAKKSVLEVNFTQIVIQIQSEPHAADLLEPSLAKMMRESLLMGAVLMLRCDGLNLHPEAAKILSESAERLAQLTSVYPNLIIILCDHVTGIIDDIFNKPTVFTINPMNAEDAQTLWKRTLLPWTDEEKASRMAEAFSINYSLPVGKIIQITKDAAANHHITGTDDGEQLQSHHILKEIQKSFRHQLGTLADVTVSEVPLSGVVLPSEARRQVDEILAYAKNLHRVLDTWGFREKSPYGNALSVLFTGVPGTGKTLLACALANELGKVLYRVDLSRIVDKYIGETEKNLGKIFDEAGKAQAIILFDEADSLFAKRTDVKSSNDRYANLEINFLLQKLESYQGMTILTTNLSKSIDDAFRRRIRFIIDFPMPDILSRQALWQRMMPPNAPAEQDIAYHWLAETFEMSGGHIRNAILKAAILASSQQKAIGMDELTQAASDEARSMGMLVRIES